jgi:hypothetical protein
MFAALVTLNDSEDINRTWENLKENIEISVKKTLGLYGISINHGLIKNVHNL